MDLVARARQYAVHAHARIEQRRKYTLQPYDVHLKGVADILATVTDDPEMLAAAWLHDTIEDTPATYEALEREFGAAVAGLVLELTDVSRPGDGNRAARKALDLRHTAGASPRAKTVKLADLIENSLDISKHDPKFARVYLAEMRALLGVLQEGDPRLLQRALRTLDKCTARLGKAVEPAPGDAAQDVDVSPQEAALFERHRGLDVFADLFKARHLLAPLPSFDEGTGLDAQRAALAEGGRAAVGVRRGGRVVAYRTREDLTGEEPAPGARTLLPRQTVALDAPLSDVIHVLTRFACCFVLLEGEVVGVVERRDVDKPVARMWLFGAIMLIETVVVEWIRGRWPGDAWTPLVSAARLEKASELLEERRRRNLGGDLLDCLQFSDKFQLVLKSSSSPEALGFTSASAAKQVLRELEQLRNHLAHGQDVVTGDWPQIARLSRRLHLLVKRRSGAAREAGKP
ncbi:MAG: HD domain-containing protein [Deltaproteobacteria bacterium]|nr:HD domain-containing protein [Deltaproteobacteria bacterium]